MTTREIGQPPSSTYRLQLNSNFTLDEASRLTDYLASLGVGCLYLSPVLAAAPESAHGYDVVDHSAINPDLGGQPSLIRLSETAAAAGLGVVLDIVPNHMGIPVPAHHNRALWCALRDGPASPYARWFDIDWTTPVMMPFLGKHLADVLRAEELQVVSSGGQDGTETVLRYFDQEYPVRPGTESLPLADLLAQQWYRLAYWRAGDDELTYRRFFNVSTLIGVRVEDPEVFAATHRLILDLVRSGHVHGLRIDHPDGLADPRGYLAALAEATQHTWVVVEKILTGEETLSPGWHCAGTTGYDAMRRIGGVFLDSQGISPLIDLAAQFTATTPVTELMTEGKRELAATDLAAEVTRLVDILVILASQDIRTQDHSRQAIHQVVSEVLIGMDRYRAYVKPGELADAEAIAVVTAAAKRAQQQLPEWLHQTVELVRDTALGITDDSHRIGPAHELGTESETVRLRAEFVTRFQQTCGPIMAKGVEDTAFYRWGALPGVADVGGHPEQPSMTPGELHDWWATQLDQWPTTMTTLSTHDTKRSEDVRARLATLTELPDEWADAVADLRELSAAYRTPDVDSPTEYLLWQTMLGTWAPADSRTGAGCIAAERFIAYAHKAIRESRTHTRWTAQNQQYEAAIAKWITAITADPTIVNRMATFVESTNTSWRANVLGQKLLQLTAPGVPDVYQGTEFVDLSLVDPDNRRPVDYRHRRERLDALDQGDQPTGLDDEKLLVVSRALRLRRTNSDWFTGAHGDYQRVATTSSHAYAYSRGRGAQVVVVITRLAERLRQAGGWGDHQLTLRPGNWHNLLTGHTMKSTGGAEQRLSTVLATLPVALLVQG
ncbi:MAG: malto-oligosyltrehalose synthase [Actinomycetota bacterium]